MPGRGVPFVVLLVLLWGTSLAAAEAKECPPGCSDHGVCNLELGRCDCPFDYHGDACQNKLNHPPKHVLGIPQNDTFCLNQCNYRGPCNHGFCHCLNGYFGADCSLSMGEDGKVKILDGAEYRPSGRPWIYVYELPSSMVTNFRAHTIDRPITFTIYERLLSSQHRVADPEQADFFYIPYGLRSAPRLWRDVFQYIRRVWPYWNNHGGMGARHLMVSTGDWGSCELYSRSRAFCTPCRPADELKEMTWLTHWGIRKKDVMFKNTGACHVPGRDIVLPPRIPDKGLKNSPFYRGDGGEPAGPAPERTILMSFAGSLTLPWLSKTDYSHNVRQMVHKHHKKTEGFEIHAPRAPDYEGMMSRSVFCLAPAGAGWGMRFAHAIAYGCIPLVIQDNIAQAWEEQLPLEKISLRVSERDIPKLSKILKAVPKERIAEMQRELGCAWPHFLYSSVYGSFMGEDGSRDAFATLMATLRARAEANHAGGVPKERLAVSFCSEEAKVRGAVLQKEGDPLCPFPCRPKRRAQWWPAGGAVCIGRDPECAGR